MKRKMIVCVMLFMVLTLCSCQKNEKSDKVSNIDASAEVDEQVVVEDRTISELIKDGEYFIIYDMNINDYLLAKDDCVIEVYVLGNNEMYCYAPVNDDTIGMFSKMSDDEIVDYVKENGENSILNGEGKVTEYAIVLYTDSTGNNVESQSICWADRSRYLEDDKLKLYSLDFYNVPSAQAIIYDCNYKGLADDIENFDYYYWYRDNNINLTLDEVDLQGENVLIDPKDEEIYDYLSLEY